MALIEDYTCPVCLGDMDWGYECKKCGADFHFCKFEEWFDAAGE